MAVSRIAKTLAAAGAGVGLRTSIEDGGAAEHDAMTVDRGNPHKFLVSPLVRKLLRNTDMKRCRHGEEEDTWNLG